MKFKDQQLLEEAYKTILESDKSGWSAILAELSKGIPGPNIFSILQEIKKSGQVSDLLKHLNDLGEQDEQNWIFKDNLIKALFMGLTDEKI